MECHFFSSVCKYAVITTSKDHGQKWKTTVCNAISIQSQIVIHNQIFFGFWRNTRKVVSETYFGEYCNKPIFRIIKEDLEKLNPPKRI